MQLFQNAQNVNLDKFPKRLVDWLKPLLHPAFQLIAYFLNLHLYTNLPTFSNSPSVSTSHFFFKPYFYSWVIWVNVTSKCFWRSVNYLVILYNILIHFITSWNLHSLYMIVKSTYCYLIFQMLSLWCYAGQLVLWERWTSVLQGGL